MGTEEKRIYSELGSRIKSLRIMRGTTQRELAEAIGRSERTVEKYEAGTQKPSLLTLYKIADYLRSNISKIVTTPSEWTATVTTDVKQAAKKYARSAAKVAATLTEEVKKMAKKNATTPSINPQPKTGKSSKAKTAGLKDGGARKVTRKKG